MSVVSICREKIQNKSPGGHLVCAMQICELGQSNCVCRERRAKERDFFVVVAVCVMDAGYEMLPESNFTLVA